MFEPAGMSDSDDDDPNVFRLAPGDRSLAGTTHEGRDFMFAVLRYVDMSDADFYWGSFQHSILEGAIFNEADMAVSVCGTPISLSITSADGRSFMVSI